jgi:predicted PurR-regulated permease PerM
LSAFLFGIVHFIDGEYLNTRRVPIPRNLSWTGWLLVLVYFGALTAISTFVVHALLDIEELLFYEVFLEVLLSTAIIYILTSVHKGLENKSWTEKRTNMIIKVLAVIFAIIGSVYMLFGLGQYISSELYPDDPTFKELEQHEQEQTIQEGHLSAIAFITCSIIAFSAIAGLWRHQKLGWYSAVALLLVQIIAITGFLDEERVSHFLFDEAANEGLTDSDLEALEKLIIPAFTGTVFAALVLNLMLITILTLPAILSCMKMPPDIFSSRIMKRD